MFKFFNKKKAPTKAVSSKKIKKKEEAPSKKLVKKDKESHPKQEKVKPDKDIIPKKELSLQPDRLLTAEGWSRLLKKQAK